MRARGIGAAVLLLATTAAAALAAAQSRDNPHGPLRFDCRACHTTKDWAVPPGVGGFDHAQTGFPLVGRHATVSCLLCHRELTFAHVGSACGDCHDDIHRGQLGPRCERCHSPRTWEARGRLLEQHAARGFPLVGVHAAADCEACHVGQQRQEFAGTPHDCFACHAADYARATSPPHAAAGFSTGCEQCHRPLAGWGNLGFVHGSKSGFGLSGAHAATACVNCHAGGRWRGLPTACFDCHIDDYYRSQNPPHAAQGFPVACEQCHGTSSWRRGG